MMIRSIVMHAIDSSNIAPMERWYYKQHSAEIARRYGTWIQRHESWMPVHAPLDAQEYGWFNWRFTQIYWRELPESGAKGEYAFTPPKHWLKRVVSSFIPAQCNNDFKGDQLLSEEKDVLRWVQFIRYPDGVDKKSADDWYINTFAKEACQHDKLYRFFSSRTLSGLGGLPGIWRDCDKAFLKGGKDLQWDRISEMWFETFADWRDFVKVNPPTYTVPVWAVIKKFPFLNVGIDFVSTFLLEQPNNDFIAEKRIYL
jgi:hypothetical protein